MEIGVLYPQSEVPLDPGAIKAYVQAVEDLGYAYIATFDHVVLATGEFQPDGARNVHNLEDSSLHEPLVFIGYMAAISRKLGYSTGILILSQRQAALVAKQVASLDIMCEGRLRLGIGTGWAEFEYEALGVPFADRGRRVEEQVAVLRGLWTQRSFTCRGEFHSISDLGIHPLPVQRPVPIWFGGGSDRPHFGNQRAKEVVMRRIARLGDGWIPQLGGGSRERALELIGQMHGFLREYGREPKALGVEFHYGAAAAGPGAWAEAASFWRGAGITHMTLANHRSGLKGIDQHIALLQAFREAVPATGARRPDAS